MSSRARVATDFSSVTGALPRTEGILNLTPSEAARMLRNAGFTNIAKMAGGMIDWDREGLPVRRDPLYELSGQCACKLKTRTGKNPLLDNHAVVIDSSKEEAQ
ncbi:MAG: rhodanese-like domain-containing protein [Treponema sp.]|nr:rhodanese-like domain-containing protein [Treponema sp.]